MKAAEQRLALSSKAPPPLRSGSHRRIISESLCSTSKAAEPETAQGQSYAHPRPTGLWPLRPRQGPDLDPRAPPACRPHHATPKANKAGRRVSGAEPAPSRPRMPQEPPLATLEPKAAPPAASSSTTAAAKANCFRREAHDAAARPDPRPMLLQDWLRKTLLDAWGGGAQLAAGHRLASVRLHPLSASRPNMGSWPAARIYRPRRLVRSLRHPSELVGCGKRRGKRWGGSRRSLDGIRRLE